MTNDKALLQTTTHILKDMCDDFQFILDAIHNEDLTDGQSFGRIERYVIQRLHETQSKRNAFANELARG